MQFHTASDGTQIHVHTVGEGSDVVLIHGWPLNHQMWESQLRPLVESGHRVTTYCRRGFGHSDKPWNGYDYDTFADDLRTVMTGAKVENAALVGFSMGGGEIARYMSRHGGQGVSRAVLISSVAPFMLKTDDNPDGVPESVFEEMKAGLVKDRPAFLAEFNQDFFGQGTEAGGTSEAMMEWARGIAMQGSLKATVDCVDAFGKTDFRPDMASFKVPTLVIHGTADKTVPIEVSGQAAAKAIDGAELVQYEGAPHAVFETHTDSLNQDLVSFLKH
ncbi:Arylesterase [Planctomycetes bacterium Poly30]|uniref:Arylesterase n=1 Tax=Saltatorellus ferox TaxID=2528018 RepID=A0A518EM45_9BACT|nr:Arylesterase [Planctomycetes bacterium Poly30]